MTARSAILLAIPALAGCISYNITPAGPAWGRLGETVAVGPARVTPLALVEDSRCPRGVQCVWPGRVRISARVATGGASQTRELTLNEPVAAGAGQLTLVAVEPAAKANVAIAPANYRFGFTFTEH